jgi:cysteinyl-tRNA synthetase
MLQVEGKKMSKSLGNFFTVRDLLDQGIPGEVIRFVFLSTHYRKPMDWTAEKARQAADLLHSWRLQTEFVEPSKPSKKIIAALSDDLNTWEAIEELKKVASRKDAPTLKASANLMGLLEDIHGAWSWKMRPGKDFNNLPEWHPANAWFREVMRPIAQVAEQLRMTFSDIPKIQMPKLNINVEAFSADLQESMRGVKQLFDYQNRISSEYPEEIATVSDEMPFVLLTIDNLDAVQRIGIASYISKRNLAKASRDYQLADEIRSELAEVGIYLEDTPEGTKWSLASDFDPAKLESLK